MPADRPNVRFQALGEARIAVDLGKVPPLAMMLPKPIVTFCWVAAIAVLGGAVASLPGAEAGGVTFDAPAGWTSAPKPMRAANYTIPAAAGDRQNGEMAVYYFGPGQGGGVEANLRRWLGQFVAADGSPLDASDADRSDEQAGGMQVTVLDVTGTYLFKPFPMAPQATPMPGYRMLAAIVQGPDAPIFFKLTAPAKTAAEAEPEFRKVIASLRR